jgi:hypothetical protein
MRIVLILSLVLGVAVLGSPAGGSEGVSGTKPSLKLVRPAPLTVQGLRFKAGERVRLTVRHARNGRRTVTAGPRGGFVVRFAGVVYDRCDGLLVTAIGSEGSRAVLTRPELFCAPS